MESVKALLASRHKELLSVPKYFFFLLSLLLILGSYYYPSFGTIGVYIAAGHGLICYWSIADKEVARK